MMGKIRQNWSKSFKITKIVKIAKIDFEFDISIHQKGLYEGENRFIIAQNIIKMARKWSETMFWSSKWRENVKLENRFFAILANLTDFGIFL